jgi:bile acid:Na+ symporter, BASS family
MSTAQIILSCVLATMVFAVALELRVADFRRVAEIPRAVIAGLIPQFLLLPLATWGATLLLDLPPNTEAAMILVACCPGGSLSNVVTHVGRGNTALSVTISAVAAPLAIVLTPFNFAWMVAANPATAGWIRELQVSPAEIGFSLLFILALPMTLGLWFGHRWPDATERIRRPLARFSLLALAAFIVLALLRDRALLTWQLLPQLGIVVAHNAGGLALGALCAAVFRLSWYDSRAVVIEGGMQNSGLALGIIALQFNADLGMVIIASLWGMWHIVSGMSLAFVWRTRDARPAH